MRDFSAPTDEPTRPQKVTTLRLPADLYEQLEQIARTEHKTMSAVIREAIDTYIAQRKADPEFQRRLQAWHSKNVEMYERLSA